MISFQSVTTKQAGNANTVTLTWPNAPASQLLVAVFGFEGVAAGSGPWVTRTTGVDNWARVLYQAPGGMGAGLEVWSSSAFVSAPTTTTFPFDASHNFVAQGLMYTGQYVLNPPILPGEPTPIRANAAQSWSGDNPATPSLYGFADEELIAVAASTLSAGFGTPTPTGSTSRLDATRSGAGTVEITAADLAGVAAGTYGPFTWQATASPGGADGAAAVLAVRPAATAPVASFVLEAPLAPDLDLPDGYQIVWAAIDPSTGADVSGVTVSNVSLFGTMLGTGDGGGIDLGPFMLVPGPAA